LIVSVTTDTGVVGWGETFGFTAIPAVKVAIDSILAPECIGRDATSLAMRISTFDKLDLRRGVIAKLSHENAARLRPPSCGRAGLRRGEGK
jgi:L-alanine-DL-glutamate epimerase-like enolase superfamily enzyme